MAKSKTTAASEAEKAAAEPAPALRIASKRPGFRRAGVAHPVSAEYEAGEFTQAELEVLEAEPTLIVERLP